MKPVDESSISKEQLNGHYKRKTLFHKWNSLGERIKRLNAIVQNPLENVTYQDYLEFQKLTRQGISEIRNLHDEVTSFVYAECKNRWIENGEMTDE